MAMYEFMESLANAASRLLLTTLQLNLLPDFLARLILKWLLSSFLVFNYKPSCEEQHSHLLQFAHSLEDMPIAVKTDKPNSQQYELPTQFFKFVFGKHMKYSANYFPSDSSTLDEAEKTMLEMYCKRAQINDGQTILDLGCGWGSLCLFIAQKYSNCKITGISYSKTQKAYIEEQCRDRKLKNVEIIVADMSTYEMDATFDRIFSIEMFEYMRNYKGLLKKISKWMKEDSLLFVHHFCHKSFAYHFEESKEELHIAFAKTYGVDWIARFFFTGGTMLSSNLLTYFQEDVTVINHWLVNGKHFSLTSEEWLKRMDQNIDEIKPIMQTIYGKDNAVKWTVYWRTYFMALAVMFGLKNGEEWMVSHFLFKKK